MSTQEHKKNAERSFAIGIITVSTTRGPAEDKSGQWIGKRAKKEGHTVVSYTVIPDSVEIISATVHDVISEYAPHALFITGGTGLSRSDVTIEAVRPMFQKELTAFGPIFAQLSFEEIDSAAILSRATAGIINNTAVFCMPGSLKACKLACQVLIFPELSHIVKHITE